jgi:glutaconate CoA-transferase subunit A
VPASRRSKLISLADAADFVQAGVTIALGGVVHANRPAAFVREIVRRRTGPLVLCSSPGSGWDADLLVATGLVSRAILPMVTMAQHGLAPSFRAAVEAGDLTAPYLDAMSLIAGYLAGGYGHPYHLIGSLEGTDLVRDADLYELLTDSEGRTHRAVRALAPDVCVLHVEEADEFGNARHRRGRGADILMARAAKRTIVMTERLVSNREVRREPHLTTVPGHLVAGVVEAPFGAHPTATADYSADDDHLARYQRAAESRRRGDPTDFDAYLREFVDGPRDAAAYRAVVGDARERALREEMAHADA